MSRYFQKAFTLIELIVVITIITILIGGSALAYNRYLRNARDTRRKLDLEQIRSALELFRSNQPNGNYPCSLLIPACDWQGNIAPYFGGSVANIPTDPSTNAIYTYTGQPGGCNNSPPGSYCTSYTIRATLENGTFYTLTPNTPAN